MQRQLVNFSNELNDRQWEAVQATDGPVLILAGAGSGKTRALTYRLAYLVATGRADPTEILAVTFTNKAAREMLERSTRLLERVMAPATPSLGRLWISTFHSSCGRILREHAKSLGYSRHFVIYDDGDQIAVIKKVMAHLSINDKIYAPKTFQFHINQFKNQYVHPQEASHQRRHFLDEKISAVYTAYEEEMRRSDAMDFGDLLVRTVDLFREQPQLLDYYQERFRYVMIDEYQDTNRVQYLLIKSLAEKYQNLCVVGDEDQSIYSWRGADISNILNFERDFPSAQVVKLEQNYRSTKNIVEAASHVIRRNSERKDKTLWTSNPDGDPILIREEMTESDEARFVANSIKNLAAQVPCSFDDFAVFYRTNAQSRVIEDQLRSHNVPYRIVGGLKFYDRAEIKDMLSYLKLIVNPKDTVSLRRIINVPTRGIGKTTIEKLSAYADQKALTLYDAIPHALNEGILDRGATRKVLEFYELLSRMIEQHHEAKPLEAYHAALDASQYSLRLRQEDTPEAEARLENLEELDSALAEFQKERGDEATLANFLEEMALVSDADRTLDQNNQNMVTLMTLHISKGLEYPVVFIVGMEEGLFPSARSIEDSGDDSCQEERRLFYVGMTRARQKLFLMHARQRRNWGQEQINPPSRFLSEIPDSYIQRASALERPKGTRFPLQKHGVESPHSYAGSFQEVEYHRAHYDDLDDVDDAGLREGMRVRHPSYGVGTVHKLEGQGNDQKVTILFHDRSLKKFVVRFARLERA